MEKTALLVFFVLGILVAMIFIKVSSPKLQKEEFIKDRRIEEEISKEEKEEMVTKVNLKAIPEAPKALEKKNKLENKKFDEISIAVYHTLKDIGFKISSIEEVVKNQERVMLLFHGEFANTGVKVKTEVKKINQGISRIKVKASKLWFLRDYPLEARIIKEISTRIENQKLSTKSKE